MVFIEIRTSGKARIRTYRHVTEPQKKGYHDAGRQEARGTAAARLG